MSVKLIVDGHGVPSGVVRGKDIESWDNRLDEALALPILHRSSTRNGKMIIDLAEPGRAGDLNDILETINLKGFYIVERDIKQDSTIEKR